MNKIILLLLLYFVSTCILFSNENIEEREMEYNPLKVQKWKICKSKNALVTGLFEKEKVIFNKNEKFIYLFSDQIAYFKSGVYLHIDSSDVEIIDSAYFKLDFTDKFLDFILKRDFSLKDDELKLVLEKHNIDVKQLVFLKKYDTKKLFLDYVNLIEEMQLNAGAGESYTNLLFIIVSQIDDSKLVQYLEKLNSRNLKLFKHELIDYTKDFGIEEPLKYFASFYPQTLYFLYSID